MYESRIIQFVVEAQTSGIRLDKALGTNVDVGSRSQATRLIDLGRVKLNGQTVKPSHITVIGEVFVVELIPDTMRELIPLDIKLDVFFEDDDLLVVNKPSGLVVHPACGHAQDTLVNALLFHTKNLSSGSGVARPGIVHRLDKDTSGLLVIAKNDATHRALGSQFKKKMVHRVYWAICHGRFKNTSGVVRSFLKRHPTDRKRFASSDTGKEAITHYTVQKELKHNTSLVHLKLETGRTHQIRVHMSEAQHPIVADPIYGRNKSWNDRLPQPPHLMLHAAELGFIHPRTSVHLKFSAPWPPELSDVLNTLGAL